MQRGFNSETTQNRIVRCVVSQYLLYCTGLGRTEHWRSTMRILLWSVEYVVILRVMLVWNMVQSVSHPSFFCLLEQCDSQQAQHTELLYSTIVLYMGTTGDESIWAHLNRLWHRSNCSIFFLSHNPLTCMYLSCSGGNPETSEGHATRYCCPLQVNARGNDSSQTRGPEKYRCKIEYLRSGKLLTKLCTVFMYAFLSLFVLFSFFKDGSDVIP